MKGWSNANIFEMLGVKKVGQDENTSIFDIVTSYF